MHEDKSKIINSSAFSCGKSSVSELVEQRSGNGVSASSPPPNETCTSLNTIRPHSGAPTGVVNEKYWTISGRWLVPALPPGSVPKIQRRASSGSTESTECSSFSSSRSPGLVEAFTFTSQSRNASPLGKEESTETVRSSTLPDDLANDATFG